MVKICKISRTTDNQKDNSAADFFEQNSLPSVHFSINATQECHPICRDRASGFWGSFEQEYKACADIFHCAPLHESPASNDSYSGNSTPRFSPIGCKPETLKPLKPSQHPKPSNRKPDHQLLNRTAGPRRFDGLL